MRPKQWTKNGAVFVPLLFDHKLFEPVFFLQVLAGFALMCLASSTVYFINDLVDIEADRQHPTKRYRPLPSGQLSKKLAVGFAIIVPLFVVPFAFLLEWRFGLTILSYLIIQVAYSFFLKNVVLIDVMTIATGFLLRVAGGVFLIDAVRFSPWLYIFTAMMALFLGFSKRRQELLLVNEQKRNGQAIHYRATLDAYNLRLLDEIILIVTAASILTYALYSFSAEGLPENHTMMLTNPFVLYGIFRYLYLIHVKGEGGAPDEVLLQDRPLQLAVMLWAFSVILILYVLA